MPMTKPTSEQVTFLAAGTGATQRTALDKLRDVVSVKDFGAVADGVTDNTAAILSMAINSGQKLIEIPYNVKFDRAALLADATFPVDVVLVDYSVINDFSYTKHIGISSRDTAADDTTFAINSGHFPVLTLNNFGTAGTASAAARQAAIQWNTGEVAGGGFRGAAFEGYRKISSIDQWERTWRSLAPWVAIANNWEYWASGQVITIGTYRVGPTSQVYVSATAGTTGATGPTHTSGTVSDGGVNWTWVDSADRTLMGLREDGRIAWNSGADNASMTFRVSVVDTQGDFVFRGESRGASKYSALQLRPTDAGGTIISAPYLLADANGVLNIMRSDSATAIAQFSDADGFKPREVVLTFTSNASTGATPNVDGVSVLSVQNGSATTITGFSGGSEGQFVHLYFSNGNTTLQDSAAFRLAGSTNVTPTTSSVVTMMKIPPGISNQWVEVSRSIK